LRKLRKSSQLYSELLPITESGESESMQQSQKWCRPKDVQQTSFYPKI